MTPKRTVGLVAVALVAIAPRPSASPIDMTDSLYSARQSAATHTFSSAMFVPSIAPTPSKIIRGNNATLQWTEVTVTSGATVHYKVMRINTNGSSLQVCVGADAPVVSAGVVTCMDRKAPVGSRYTEQPYIVGTTGAMTWSLPPSAMSNP